MIVNKFDKDYDVFKYMALLLPVLHKYSSTGNNLVNDNNQESHTYSLRLPKTVKLVCELK